MLFRLIEPIHFRAPRVDITLCAALIKFDRFEWIVEKATELGVERILPVETARVEKGLFAAARKRTERWVRVARESSQQSRRVRVPEILSAVRLEKALSQSAGQRYFLEEATAPPLLQVLPAERAAGACIAVMAGPEGGWTDAERLLAAAAGWQPVIAFPKSLTFGNRRRGGHRYFDGTPGCNPRDRIRPPTPAPVCGISRNLRQECPRRKIADLPQNAMSTRCLCLCLLLARRSSETSASRTGSSS